MYINYTRSVSDMQVCSCVHTYTRAHKFIAFFTEGVYFCSPVPSELPLSFHLQESIQPRVIQRTGIEQAVHEI